MSRNEQIKMTAEELEAFLEKYDLSDREFASMLGVTDQAVTHWVQNRRSISPIAVKLIRYFEKNPQAMMDFQ